GVVGSRSAALASPASHAPPSREVTLWTARDVAPGPRVRLTLNTRNVPVVHLAAYRLEGIAWLIRRSRAESGGRERARRPRAAGGPVRAWDVTLASRRERPNPMQRDVYR